MFQTVKRIIDWCGSFKKQLYIGFIFSFLSSWFAAMPVAMAAMLIGQLVEDMRADRTFDSGWILKSFLLMLLLIFLRFLFDYLRARFQESISYELIARDRLAVGDAFKEGFSWIFPDKKYWNDLKCNHDRTSYVRKYGDSHD